MAPRRVVVAEDDPDIRELLLRWLRTDERFAIAGSATNGVEATDLVKAEQPDVLIIDLGLPVLDGASVLTHVRRAHPGTKIVVYSGDHSLPPDARSAADMVLLKAEFQLSELGSALASLFD